MTRTALVTTAIGLLCCLAISTSAVADITYNVLPQTLRHEGDDSEQFITAGTIIMVDGAADDGILQKEELLEARIYNTMAGEIHAYDDFDFSNVNATFENGFLVGSLRIQHTDNGEGFVEWDAQSPMISISNLERQEFAQLYPWEAPHRIAQQAVPEPSSTAAACLLGMGWLGRRRRQPRQ